MLFLLFSTAVALIGMRESGINAAALYTPLCAFGMGVGIFAVCYGYFKEQNRLMEDAVVRIREFISGDRDARIECNEEGELYRLFHEVNSLAAILNAQAEKEGKSRKFLQNTISDISHQLKTPLAAHSPAKRAAGVSPVAAVSGNAETGKSFSHAANTRLFKVESALGVYHAVSAKKNLILISLSFAFTVALFLTFFAGLDFARKLLPSESDFNPDISIAAADNSNSFDRNLKEEMSALPGVEAAFGCAFAFDTPADINGTAGKVDLMSYDDYMFYFSKKSVVSGDISKITDNSDYALTIFNKDSRLDVGDKIKIGDTELEIACVVSEGVGSENNPSVVCTEETFARITGEDGYILLNAQLTEDATEETVDMLRALAGENEFADRRDDNYTMYSFFWVFRLAAYGFLGIIAVITIFNIMNSISMSVSARMKQYGAMRAVGMSAHQLAKMIAAEAVTYAVCGLLIGSAAGLYLHRKITIRLIIDHFGGVWKVPVDALVIIVLIVIFSCVSAVYAPAKRMREMEITETINEFIN